MNESASRNRRSKRAVRTSIRVIGAGLLLLGRAGCGGHAEAPQDAGVSDAARVAYEAGTKNPLTCAWLHGPNCWTDAAASVVACIGTVPVAGNFSADRKTCNGDDGATATFPDGPPPTNPPPAPVAPPFTITRGGNTCLSFKATSETQEFVTPLGTFSTFDNGYTFTVTCPDGTTFSATGTGPTGWGGAIGPCDVDMGPGLGWGGGGGFSANLTGGGIMAGPGILFYDLVQCQF
jgi:hypothetical protein